MRDWVREVERRLAAAGLDGAAEREIAEELAQHLEDEYEALRGRGVAPDEARAQVLRELGTGSELARAVGLAVPARPEPLAMGRPTWRGWASGVWGDVTYAARSLVRSPLYAGVAVVVIGVGIGANTVLFTAVNALLLKAPGGVASPEELAVVFTSDFSGPRFGSSSYPDYEDIRGTIDAFESVAAVRPQSFGLSGDGWTTRVMGEIVSPGYFGLLGVTPAAGRLFDAAADTETDVVVISHELWQTRFGGETGVIGRRLTVRGQPLTIIGVTPAAFRGTIRGLRLHVWLPATGPVSLAVMNPQQRGDRGMMVIGRRHDGVPLEAVQAQLDVLASQLHRAYPETWTDVNERSRVFTVVPEAEARVPRQARGAVLGGVALLMTAVLLVLLIACTNVANLMLSRAAVRRGEIGVRIALGATRAQIARHLLAESVLLALLGGAAGVLFAAWLSATLRAARFPVPIALDLAVDLRVLGFAAALTLGTGILFGLAPALEASRAPAPLLRDGTRAGQRLRLRHALLVSQIAASLVLLVGSGLLIRSLLALQGSDTGLDVDGVALVRIELDLDGYTPEQAWLLHDELLQRASALPGTTAAALAETVPLSAGFSRRYIRIAGYEPRVGENMEVMYNGVTPGYFATMGVRVRGRGFTAGDREDAPPVAIVSEAFARRYWPGADPIGRRLSLRGADVPFAEVIGVASDARYRSTLEEPQPYVYYPYQQGGRQASALLVRSAGDTDALVRMLRAEVGTLLPNEQAAGIQTFRSHMAAAVMPQRVAALLLGILSLFAAGIALIGLYGLVAFGVAQRAHEFGVRMALGATARDVRLLVTRHTLRLVALGIACGTPLAVALALLVRQFLSIAPVDPVAFLTMPLLLAGSALLASYVPARRAAAQDPLTALRAE